MIRSLFVIGLLCIAACGGESTDSNANTGGAGGAAGGTTAAGTQTGGASGSCNDGCPAPKGGLTVACKKRFLYGANFAWKNFATDFGGKTSWSQKGVASDKAGYTAAIKDMKDNGVDVIRWWMFPDLRGDGIKLDSAATKNATGLGDTVVDDINAALAIAAEQDVHIILTIFSFDNFKPDSSDSPGLSSLVTDAGKRAALMTNVVHPIARAVEASPNKDRMIAWDVINEPEWALSSGSDPYGDPAFDGQTNLTTIPFADMETFVKDTVTAIKAESKAPVTVGSAAVKWAKAWSKVGLDYHDFHWYGWVDQWFAHTKTPVDYKVDDQPVVVGEFPFNPNADTTGKSFGGLGYNQLITDFFDEGYAGAMGWAYSDTTGGAFSWATAKANVKAWADAHTCITHY
ncbi:MAG TPA: endo-1,4-beta-glucanase [Polyangia bacterium]